MNDSIITRDDVMTSLMDSTFLDGALEIYEEEMRDSPVPVDFTTWLIARQSRTTIPSPPPLPGDLGGDDEYAVVRDEELIYVSAPAA